MKDQVEERLTEVFHDVFEDDAIVVTRELTADKVDGWDSLTHVRLLLTIERKFGVKISAMDAGKLKTVGDLLDLLDAKLGKQKG
jgi:acyl carrier protein